MQLTLVAGGTDNCAGKHCPTVYTTDTGSFVVQGYTVSQETSAELGAGESLVEIPESLVRELAARI